jgi:hypothetical protein
MRRQGLVTDAELMEIGPAVSTHDEVSVARQSQKPTAIYTRTATMRFESFRH